MRRLIAMVIGAIFGFAIGTLIIRRVEVVEKPVYPSVVIECRAGVAWAVIGVIPGHAGAMTFTLAQMVPPCEEFRFTVPQ